MYLEHFNLKQAPFAITPNTEFFQSLPSHEEALNTLLVGVKGGEGFIKITGEVGTGKTLLCRKLLNSLGPDYKTIYIPNPCLTSIELYKNVLDELGLGVDRLMDHQAIIGKINQELIEYARLGKQVVLVVDEAQALPPESLEALRLLTNLETESKKLLQIVLFGQPELDDLLTDNSMRQLRQRIIFSYKLQPLCQGDMSSYINQRLKCAGCEHLSFEKESLNLLYKASKGIPRIINILCHKALMVAYGQGRIDILVADIKKAIADTDLQSSISTINNQATDYKIIVGGFLIAILGGVIGSMILSHLPF